MADLVAHISKKHQIVNLTDMFKTNQNLIHDSASKAQVMPYDIQAACGDNEIITYNNHLIFSESIINSTDKELRVHDNAWVPIELRWYIYQHVINGYVYNREDNKIITFTEFNGCTATVYDIDYSEGGITLNICAIYTTKLPKLFNHGLAKLIYDPEMFITINIETANIILYSIRYDMDMDKQATHLICSDTGTGRIRDINLQFLREICQDSMHKCKILYFTNKNIIISENQHTYIYDEDNLYTTDFVYVYCGFALFIPTSFHVASRIGYVIEYHIDRINHMHCLHLSSGLLFKFKSDQLTAFINDHQWFVKIVRGDLLFIDLISFNNPIIVDDKLEKVKVCNTNGEQFMLDKIDIYLSTCIKY